jgi:hypothetical protein
VREIPVRTLAVLALCVGLSACLGPGGGQTAGDPPTADTTTPDGPPETASPVASREGTATGATPPASTLSNESASRRAVAAEERRIGETLSGWANISWYSTGDVAQSEYTVLDRNETGVLVRVRGVHSGGLECETNESYTIDGWRTETRYFVTEGSVRLVTVSKDVIGKGYDPC